MREDWRKEFDKKWDANEFALESEDFDLGEYSDPEKIKAFIASLLTTRTEQAVAEERKQVATELREMCLKSSKEPVSGLAIARALTDYIPALQDPRRGGGESV